MKVVFLEDVLGIGPFFLPDTALGEVVERLVSELSIRNQDL